jgi:hypothetical protein
VWGNVTSTIVPSVDSKKIKILLAGYTAILVTALRRQYYEQAWGFLSEMKMLLCYICKDKNEIPNVIQKCLSGDIKLVRIPAEINFITIVYYLPRVVDRYGTRRL